MLKNLGAVIAMGSMGYSDDYHRDGFATHADPARIEYLNPFGLNYLEMETHSDRRGIDTFGRSAPLL